MSDRHPVTPPPVNHVSIADSDTDSDIADSIEVDETPNVQYTSLFGPPLPHNPAAQITATSDYSSAPTTTTNTPASNTRSTRRPARANSILHTDYADRPSRESRHCTKYSKTDRTCDHESSPSNKSTTSLSPSLNPYKSFSNTATILVGPQETPFTLHTSILERGSSFFAAAFNGSFQESQTKTLKLPDIEPKYFEHIALWLYSGRLESPPFFYKDGKPTYFTLLDLYGLADRLCLTSMRNALVERIADLAESTNSVPTPSDTYILYETLRETSPIRTLILDLFAYKKTDNLIATHPDDWHPQFLRDLICRLKKPGSTSITRHDVRPWKPLSWQTTRACEGCRGVLRPSVVAMMCAGCQKGFCLGCVERGEGGGCEWGVSERGCKPWLRGNVVCERYHEHEGAGEVEGCREGRK